MTSFLRRLRAAWFDMRSRETDPLRRYWAKRALRYGHRSVLNLGHREAELAEVTGMQRTTLFPLLRAQLRGREGVVLDYGCGAGRFTTDLADIVHGKAIGVDPTEQLIEIAPRSATVEYYVLQDDKLPLPDASVDVAWICLVLGCIPDERLNLSIAELRRVIRHEGLVFLVENTAQRPDRPYFHFRPVEKYRELFSWAALEPIGGYDDLGERISVLAGRVRNG
jgi:ubiquinone/menaquinone biosynthesis C-methylase UbiE